MKKETKEIVQNENMVNDVTPGGNAIVRPENSFEKAERILKDSNLFEALAGGLSMRKLSEISGTSYAKLLRLSHAPIAGEAYDPEKLNAKAVATAVAIQMDEAAFVGTDWMKVLEESQEAGAVGGQGGGKIVVNPEVGDKVYFTRPGANKSFAKFTNYTILMKNEAQIVAMNTEVYEDAEKGKTGEYLVTKISTANNMGIKVGIAPAAPVAEQAPAAEGEKEPASEGDAQ